MTEEKKSSRPVFCHFLEFVYILHAGCVGYALYTPFLFGYQIEKYSLVKPPWNSSALSEEIQQNIYADYLLTYTDKKMQSLRLQTLHKQNTTEFLLSDSCYFLAFPGLTIQDCSKLVALNGVHPLVMRLRPRIYRGLLPYLFKRRR